MDMSKMRREAEEMILSGVKAADPERLVDACVKVDGDVLEICGKEFDKERYDSVMVFGIGKASVSMAQGLEKLKPDDGVVITKKGKGHDELSSSIEILEAHHPYPEQENIEAAERLLEKLDMLENALIIFLVSGGGSALFLSPVEGISLEEMNQLNRLLVKSGADIYEINSVRKHLSKVKGGRFARLCEGKGDLVSLIISDVVGDDLSVVASGPTYPDSSTYKDAVEVLREYGLWEEVSDSIREHLKKGVDGKMEETPGKLDVDNFLIGNNLTALKGVKKAAEKKSFNPDILTSQNTGEARVVAKPIMGIAKEVQDSGNPIEPPAALIIGGEMTVAFEKKDTDLKGGPNREFVLSSALQIRDRENIVVASVDSDGTDGVGKSGAIADPRTVKKTTMDPKKYLDEHNTEEFFDSVEGSISFESNTNVNDITVVLVGGKE